MVMNRIGWILATDAEDSIRDGARALSSGLRATALTRELDATSLDTLAAAQAEMGRVAERGQLSRAGDRARTRRWRARLRSGARRAPAALSAVPTGSIERPETIDIRRYFASDAIALRGHRAHRVEAVEPCQRNFQNAAKC